MISSEDWRNRGMAPNTYEDSDIVPNINTNSKAKINMSCNIGCEQHNSPPAMKNKYKDSDRVPNTNTYFACPVKGCNQHNRDKERKDFAGQDHYNGYQVLEMIFAAGYGKGFCLGNVLKYVARAELKGTELDDLQKAKVYLDYYLEYANKKS